MAVLHDYIGSQKLSNKKCDTLMLPVYAVLVFIALPEGISKEEAAVHIRKHLTFTNRPVVVGEQNPNFINHKVQAGECGTDKSS